MNTYCDMYIKLPFFCIHIQLEGVYARVYWCARVCACECVCARVCVWASARVCLCVRVNVCMRVCACLHVWARECVRECVYARVCVCVRACLCVWARILTRYQKNRRNWCWTRNEQEKVSHQRAYRGNSLVDRLFCKWCPGQSLQGYDPWRIFYRGQRLTISSSGGYLSGRLWGYLSGANLIGYTIIRYCYIIHYILLI